MEFAFYQSLFSRLSIALEAHFSTTAGNVAAAFTPVATTLMCLYLVFWGFTVMRGMASETVLEGAVRLVKMAFIVAFAINVGIYNSYLASLLWAAPDALASVVAGGSGESSMHFLDSLALQFFELAQSFTDSAYADSGLTGLPDLSLWAAGWAVLAGGLLMTGYAAFLFVLAKIALSILLGIGAIFILMTLFDATKHFFMVWIGQCLNYVFLVLLTASSVRLVMTIISSYLDAALSHASDPAIIHALPAIAFSLIGILVMVQLPSVAAALGGGAALGTQNAAGRLYAKTGAALKTRTPGSAG